MARDHLDAVEPRALQAQRTVCVTLDDLAQHLDPHRLRGDVKALARHGRRGECEGERPVRGLHDLAARVEDLRDERRAVRVHRFREPPVPGNALVVCHHEQVRGVPRALVHPRDLHDDHPRAACRPSLVVRDELIGDPAVLVAHHRVVAGGEDPVLERHMPEPEGGEQMGEGGGSRHV